MYNIQITENCNYPFEEISFFIECIFDEFIAPEYTKEGIFEFKKYIDPERIEERLSDNHFILFALDDFNKLAGLIEIRSYDHISLLFVRRDMQKKGIARKLFIKVIKKCLKEKPNLKHISVHSSPNSVTAYEKMGFIAVQEEKEINGLRFTSMSYQVK